LIVLSLAEDSTIQGMEPIQLQVDLTPSDEGTQTAADAGNRLPAILASLCLHLSVILVATFVTISLPDNNQTIELVSEAVRELPTLPLKAEVLSVYDEPTDQIGADSPSQSVSISLARSTAQEIAATSNVPPPEVMSTRLNDIDPAALTPVAVGLEHDDHVIIRGVGGMGITTTQGAVDRLTQEILLSLEEQPTLVVWIFDQSPSLNRQRKEIWERLDRVYTELSSVQASGSDAFKHDVTPLLSAVIAFGESVELRTRKPIEDVAELQNLIRGIPEDKSGIENVFSALKLAVDRFKSYRKGSLHEPKRNVLLIVFSDEVGDDSQLLDSVVASCQRWTMPVYIVGVPAPFGQDETFVKWVDPDPRFDQTPQWGRVSQGPETLLPERLRIDFDEAGDDLDSIDSGFGPFALTRLCVETGGIYFAVHPNRRVGSRVSRSEVDPFSSYLKFFFSSDVMRKYRPQYVSAKDYYSHVTSNRCRKALVEAARASGISPMKRPETHFIRREEAQFVNDLFNAQKQAARLEPEINQLFQILKQGEVDREQEDIPRWQAGYDLAMGRILALKVRTESYNAMLAQAKRGIPTEKKESNTFTLVKSQEVDVGSHLEGLAEKARMYLNRVLTEHPETPWALLAQRELNTPLGWEWRESFTPLATPEEMMGNGTPVPPRDQERRMLERPLPTRPVPRL
jgi:hypothetical protein